ncbi:MAG: ATP-dependent DNA ligase [Candidatus Thermoplasmatota archaeon]
MKFAELASFFERLEGTSGRLEMTAIVAEMLAKVPTKDLLPVVRLLQGAVAPDWEGIELGVAEKQILKVLALATSGSAKSEEAAAKLEKLYHEKGDLGLAAEAALGGGRKQASLFGSQPLTVGKVFATLQEIAATTGTGSQDAKQRLLSKLLLDATPLEARYITRTVAGRLRLGVADMTFLDALAAWHLGKGVRSVTDMEDAERAEQEALRAELERAYDLRSDLAVVAQALADGGPKAVAKLGIQAGIPVRPMASERLKTFGEILAKMDGRVGMEYKYDGLRMQAHVAGRGKKTPTVRLFSRRLEDFTAQFPDVVAELAREFAGHDIIVEGEAVALDDDGRLRPFQDVARRRGRKADLEAVAAEVPITLFLFDLIAVDGESEMHLPMAERRARLAKLVGKGGAAGRVRMSTQQVATDEKGMERFFDAAVEDGAEGIMCKDPRAPYKAGSRGFAWVKFKTDYTESLVDTMDLVCIGAFYGRGRRAGWWGATLMAAWDPDAQAWQSVCKLGTGFDDETLKGLKDRFAKHVSEAKPDRVDSGLEPDVWFQPKVVMEVQAAELTLSPTHRAGWGRIKPEHGFAARFPRFTGRWRDDKGPKDATTVKELQRLHETKGQARP